MAKFDFDEVIDRRAVPALKHHRMVLGDDGMELFATGVADMGFRVLPCITRTIAAPAPRRRRSAIEPSATTRPPVMSTA